MVQNRLFEFEERGVPCRLIDTAPKLLARWIAVALPGTFVDSAPWNRGGRANDAAEGMCPSLVSKVGR